jgi:hypothetical protein
MKRKQIKKPKKQHVPTQSVEVDVKKSNEKGKK